MMADQRGRDKKGDERELLFQTRNKQKQQQPSLLDRTLCIYIGEGKKRRRVQCQCNVYIYRVVYNRRRLYRAQVNDQHSIASATVCVYTEEHTLQQR